MKNNYKPGDGWSYLGSGVYENLLRSRVHLGGMVRIKTKTGHKFFMMYNGDDGTLMRHYVRVNGGNRKRGMMAFTKYMENYEKS